MIEILTKALALIKGGWTQNVFARDAEGRCVSFMDDRACRFCLGGALFRADNDQLSPDCVAAMNALGVECVGTWNDVPGRTQEEVVALLERTINVAQGS